MAKQSFVHALVAGLAFLLGLSSTVAQQVEYTLTATGGDSWRYDYSIATTTSSLSFDELTVYFGNGLFTSLGQVAAPTGWDPLIVQPDASLPADGFFDVLSTSGPVALGSTITGFSVSFSYLAGMTPGAQRFEFIDSGPFAVVVAGMTSPLTVASPVPEPETYLMFIVGLLVLGAGRASRAKRAAG